MKRYFLGAGCLSLALFLTSCGTPQVTEDSTGSTSTGTNFSTDTINLETDDIQALSTHMFSESGQTNIQDYIAALTGSDADTVEKRTYLQSLIGDYENAIAGRDALCATDPAQCPGEYIVLDVGEAYDQSGNTISSPNVYLDGTEIASDERNPSVYNNFVHRVRVEKEGYLDAYSELNGVEGGFNTLSISPKMAKADSTATVTAENGGSTTAGAMSYTIAPNSFTNANGEAVTGAVDVYTFSLDRNDNDLSVFQLDAYDANGVKVGDSFITYGMPYVTAYQNGEALDISAPIEGTGVILYQDDMDLVNVPKNVWLTGEQLAQYNIPPFWNLDRKAGVWHETQLMILDEAGNYRFRLNEKDS